MRVPAKLNLHLAVGPRRPDGFHHLTTVLHAVALYDQVSVAPARRLTVTISGEGAGALPTGRDNLAGRAVQVFSRVTGAPDRVAVTLTKAIPVAAGLAGGSADAAGTLVGCDALFGTGLSRAELTAMAAELGSDVPFSVVGGTALGTGRGERLTPVLTAGQLHWVLAVAAGQLSAADVYAELDRLRGERALLSAGRPDALLAALRVPDARQLGPLLANELQPAAVALHPPLRRTLAAGLELGALGGLVSGSGPTCAFLAKSEQHAVRLAAALGAEGVCRTVRVAAGPVPGARLMSAGRPPLRSPAG